MSKKDKEKAKAAAEAEQVKQEAEAAEAAMDPQLKAALDDLAAAVEKREEQHQQYLRLQADFDNYRKRSRIDQENAVKFGTEKLLKELLPVLDNLERALAAADEASPLKAGVEMTCRQFLDVLSANGVTRIEALGADFDPNLHQAVMQEDLGEENKGKVTMVVQQGYMLSGRLLRAAMVQVGM